MMMTMGMMTMTITEMTMMTIDPSMKSMQGFSLLEMMFVSSLLLVVAGVIFMTTRSGTEQNNAVETRMTLQDSAREGLYKMTQEIRQSAPEKITIDDDDESITFEIPDPDDLVEDTSYALNWEDAHQIRYSLGGDEGRQVMREDLTTGDVTYLANDVASLSFEGDSEDPSLVTINMGLQRLTPEGRTVPEDPLEVSTQAAVRNEFSGNGEEEEEEDGEDEGEDDDHGDDDDDDDDHGDDDDDDHGSDHDDH